MSMSVCYVTVMFVSLWRCAVPKYPSYSISWLPLSDLVDIITTALQLASFLDSQIAANASRPPSLSVFMSSLITSRCSGSPRTCCSCPRRTGPEQWAWWNVSSSNVTGTGWYVIMLRAPKNVTRSVSYNCSILTWTNRAVINLNLLWYRCFRSPASTSPSFSHCRRRLSWNYKPLSVAVWLRTCSHPEYWWHVSSDRRSKRLWI